MSIWQLVKKKKQTFAIQVENYILSVHFYLCHISLFFLSAEVHIKFQKFSNVTCTVFLCDFFLSIFVGGCVLKRG